MSLPRRLAQTGCLLVLAGIALPWVRWEVPGTVPSAIGPLTGATVTVSVAPSGLVRRTVLVDVHWLVLVVLAGGGLVLSRQPLERRRGALAATVGLAAVAAAAMPLAALRGRVVLATVAGRSVVPANVHPGVGVYVTLAGGLLVVAAALAGPIARRTGLDAAARSWRDRAHARVRARLPVTALSRAIGRDRDPPPVERAGPRGWGIDRGRSPALSRDDLPYLAGVVGVGAAIYLRNLGGYTLRRWDEAIYATAADLALREGHWLVLRVSGGGVGVGGVGPHLFLEKPPLGVWFQAVSMAALGRTEFAVRAPSAVAAVLTGVVVYTFGRDLADRRVGVVAALAFLSTPIVYAGNNAGRLGGLDTTMALFGTLSVYLAWSALDRDAPRRLVAAAVAAGLATLVKGPNAGVFALPLAGLVVADARPFRSRAALAALGAWAAVVLPWAAYAWLRYPREFVDQLFREQVVDRVLGERYVAGEDALFEFMHYPYFVDFPVLFAPWSYLLLPAAGLLAWRACEAADRRMGRDVALLAWWAGSTLVLFALTGNHHWYLLPMAVPVALLVGGAVVDVADRATRAGAVALGIGVATVLAFSPRLAGISPLAGEWRLPTGSGAVSGDAFLLLVLAVAAGLGRFPAVVARVATRVPPLRLPPVRRVAGVAVAAAVVLALVGAPPALGWGGDERLRTFAEHIDAEAPPGATVHGETGLERYPLYSFAFYLDRPLRGADRAAIERDGTIEYAVLERSTASSLSRERGVTVVERVETGYNVAQRSGTVTLVFVALDPPAAESSDDANADTAGSDGD